MVVRCPQCGNPVYWNPSYPYRPFWSERCKLIDFGAWINEEHVISSEPIDPDSSCGDLSALMDTQ
ncbi:MAG: DNA gyrase inhibitor YacG [Methylococcales bacterium]